MKLPTMLQLFLISVFLLTLSCSKYETGGTWNYQNKWCKVQQVGSHLMFLGDDGSLLQPSKDIDPTLFAVGNRFKILYIKLGEAGHYSGNADATLVELIHVRYVLVTPILVDSLRNVHSDPVALNDPPFIGGGYINFDFVFDFASKDIEHSIELVQDTIVNRICKMRLLHLANGDRGGSFASALVSFPLNGLDRSSIDSLVIDVQGYNNQLTNCRLSMRDSIH